MSREAAVNSAQLDASDDSDDEDFLPDAPLRESSRAKRSKANADEDEDDEIDSDAEEAAVQALAYDSGDEKTIALAEEDSASPTSRKRKRDERATGKDEQHDSAGFVKTRSQRQEDAAIEQETRNQAAPVSSKADVDAIWASLNAPSTTADTSTLLLDKDEYVTIQRDYTFAGEMHHEEKRVLRDSAEGRAFLAAQQQKTEKQPTENTTDSGKPKLGPPRRKRVSKLDQAAASQKAAKLNTLEKSRLEWASFVDKEGIADDLKLGNRDGYNVKQDFLRDSEGRRNDAFKAGQQQAKK
ncbi:bucentaur or craniofacial development-domain-containing protein [Protomyces lactucae-debilis]|uniref:SWR1-complex protein 5 n=1 Tax=Protomyces lactucae-debilis TaxID=2754530 RepID=A0A1Y2FDQ6_PROLT|nr:bucentaur or craniofacial development-domain-containing protein [Protomyces lactucae-debilis]ORY82050.1 bucentaur or craniofacial development-domain-containing protein [Protomyces lactucae-debilis]